MVAKFVASTVTGSSTMLAEGFHSLADVLNQTLLLLGIERSNKDANIEFHSGFGRERFIWSLISAVGVFFLGCGASLYHGISGLLSDAHHELTNIPWAIGVLLFSLIVEGIVLYLAASSLIKQATAEDIPFMDYIDEQADPTEVAVLLEDSAACLGLVIALIAIGLTYWTGELYWDAIGSILIGVLLGFVAIVLVQKNRSLLIGRSIPATDMKILRSILNSKKYLGEIQHIRAEVIGSGKYEVQIEIEFNEHHLVQSLPFDLKTAYDGISTFEDFQGFCTNFSEHAMQHMVTTIDELELEIQNKIPEIEFIDIEPN
jgi:solute carrier family 30 (zinc transporter), member 9